MHPTPHRPQASDLLGRPMTDQSSQSTRREGKGRHSDGERSKDAYIIKEKRVVSLLGSIQLIECSVIHPLARVLNFKFV